MKASTLLRTVYIVVFSSSALTADVIHIPANYASIQAGIDAAADGDTVLVAPGEYHEQLELANTGIVLGSWFLTTGDPSYIGRTIVDGDGEATIAVRGSAGTATTIVGFSIRNGRDGINTRAPVQILNNHITDCEDGIDYGKGSGGICRFNVIEENRSEGLHVERDLNIVIENNIIRYNGSDGIQIRFDDYSGPPLTYVIRRNLIHNNGQDGIHLIDLPGLSRRTLTIERNLIYNHFFAGFGCTSEGNIKENYEGANVLEPIYLTNNTFASNNYGVTGGDNLIALNNLIVGSATTAMKNVDGNSIVAYSNFWGNGKDFENCNKDETTVLFGAPLLEENYHIAEGSACIDNGTAFFVWQSDTVLNIPSTAHIGAAPDIGAFEYDPSENPIDFVLSYSLTFNRVELVWQANNTESLQGFEIQRSKHGIHLEKIAFVERQGDSTSFQEYRYVDATLTAGGTYYYRLKRIENDSSVSLSKVLQVELVLPKAYALFPNYPNPAGRETSFEYHLPVGNYVIFRIYNSLGQKVRTLVDEEQPAGFHTIQWDRLDEAGNRVASGVYFYELHTGSFQASRKLMVLN